MTNEKQSLDLILTRRSVKPKHMLAPAPDETELAAAAQCAMRAPNHGEALPCRFVAVEEKDREALARLFAAAARRQGGDEERIAKAASKAKKGPAIVAFIAGRDENPTVSREMTLSAGAALENFLLALHAMGYGGIVLSGSVLEDEELQRAFVTDSNREVLCAWITVGTPDDTVEFAPEDRKAPLSRWTPVLTEQS